LQLTLTDDCLVPHGKRETKKRRKKEKIMPEKGQPKKERKLTSLAT